MDMGPCLNHYDHAIRGYRQADVIQELTQVLIDKMETQYRLAPATLEGPANLQVLEEMLDILKERKPRLCGRIFAILSQVYRYTRQDTKAQVMAQHAFALGQALGDDDLSAQAGAAMAMGYIRRLHVREAVDYLRLSVEAARRVNNVFFASRFSTHLSLVLALQGQLEEAETTALAAYKLARPIHGEGATLALSLLASVAVSRGNFVDTERYNQETLIMASRSDYPWGGFRSLMSLACAHALCGARRDAETTLDLILEPGQLFYDVGTTTQVFVATFRQLVRAYTEMDGATIKLQVSEVMQYMKADTYSLAPLCALVELADLMAAPEVVEQPSETLALAAKQGLIFSSGWTFLIPRVLGVAATLQQRWDQAEGYFQAALVAAERSGTQPELGRTYLDYARMLSVRAAPDERPRAIELLTHARAIFNTLGMHPFAYRTSSLLQGHS